jgi:hypothetical protein
MKYSKGDSLVPKGKQYPDCAVVVDGYDERGHLVMDPMGGGLETHLAVVSASAFRLVSEDERAGTFFRRIRFALADSDEVFTGWADGRRWNGWTMPRFERPEAERLIRWLGDGRARFDAERDGFITISQDDAEEDWAGESVTVSDGSAMKVYLIAAGAWMWDEVEPQKGGAL